MHSVKDDLVVRELIAGETAGKVLNSNAETFIPSDQASITVEGPEAKDSIQSLFARTFEPNTFGNDSDTEGG